MINQSFLENNSKEILNNLVILKTEGFPTSFKGKNFKYAWRYKNNDIEFWTVRYEAAEGEKVIIPLPSKDRNGRWKIGSTEGLKTPLYGLDEEYQHGVKENKTLYFVEGEKCATALQYIGLNATTSIGGAAGAKRSRYEILKNFSEIIIIPDNDEPGVEYAKQVRKLILEAGFKNTLRIKSIGSVEGTQKADFCDWLKLKHPDWDEFSFKKEFRENAKLLQESLLKDLQEKKLPETLEEPDEWGYPIEPKEYDYSCDTILDGSHTTKEFNDLCVSVQEHLETPLAFIQAIALGSVASAAQGTFEFTSKTTETLSQPVGLYIMAFLKSGERKGPVFKFFSKPLLRIEEKLHRGFVKKHKAWKLEYDNICTDLQDAKRRKNKSEIKELLEKKSKITALQPPPIRFIGDNLTPEALVRCIKNAPHGLSLISEEPRDFLDIFTNGKYSSCNSQFDILLKSYDGSPIRVDRATAKGPGDESYSETIKNPRLSIIISGQPHILNTLTEGELASSGFLGRFNIICPPSLVGKRKNNMIKNSTPTTQLDWYNGLIHWIFNFKEKESSPTKLFLSEEAELHLQTKIQNLEQMFNNEYE